jgi:uncharacterized membrane protein
MNTTSLRWWQGIAIGIYVGFLGSILFWPSLPLPTWPGSTVAWNMYASVHGVCAQVHNITVAGEQLPLCARNTGIYGAMTLSLLTMIALGRFRVNQLPNRWVMLLLATPVGIMAVDGFNSMFVDLGWQPLYQPQNWLRTLTGAFAGIAVAPFFVALFNNILRTNAVSARTIRHVGEVLLLWAIAGAYAALVIIGPAWAYWPISVISWVGLIGILLFSNVFAVAVAMGYDQKISHVTDLAKPMVIASIITAIELGGMAWLRFGFESNGWM